MAPRLTRAQSAAASQQARTELGTSEEEVIQDSQEQLPLSPFTLQVNEMQKEFSEIQAKRTHHQMNIQLARAKADEAAGFPIETGPAPFTVTNQRIFGVSRTKPSERGQCQDGT